MDDWIKQWKYARYKVHIDSGLIYSRKPEFGMLLQIHAIYRTQTKYGLQLVKLRLYGIPRINHWFRLLQSISRMYMIEVSESSYTRSKQ